MEVIQQMPHISRQPALKAHLSATDGMGKAQFCGVQRLTGDILIDRMIEVVGGEGMAEIIHMNPDLVRASCPKPYPQKRIFCPLLYDFKVCQGSLAIAGVYSSL